MTDDRPRFDLAAYDGPDGVRVNLSGELDLSQVAVADRVLSHLSLPARTLTLDLTGLEFCDSMGLQCLIRIRAAAIGADWRFQVINVQSAVRRVFDITGLTEHLNVVDGGPSPS
jgi:anti-sigma B factor antagonist